jgi:hypothetical protein
MSVTFKFQHSVLILSLATAYPLQAFAAAGVAQFTAGDVSVRGGDGQTSPLTKGKDIESGQAILTGATGRAQVKFTDGGLISLQPNTEFKIASYVDKADPKEDRFLVDLLRGSMRAITGLIGKRNRDNYRVTTTTATIGIRGSGFSAGYNPDGSLGVSAEKDAIEVCNAGVCVGLVAGESVKVNNTTSPPTRTVNKAPVPTPGTAQEAVVAGNQTNANGKSSLVDAVPAPSGTFTTLGAKAFYDPSASLATFDQNPLGQPTILANGALTSFTNSSGDVFTPVAAVTDFGSVGTMAGNDFIGWGYWTGVVKTFGPYSNTYNNLHYVVGVPTAVMPTSGVATYSFIGGAAPRLFNGAVGTISSASTLTADFGIGSMSATIITSFGTITGGTLYSGNSFSTGSNEIKGAFFGPNASRAGLVYTGYNAANSGYYSGSAVFQK